ncbi:MAG: HTTM domain-containing protein [Myxococcota bacterium]
MRPAIEHLRHHFLQADTRGLAVFRLAFGLVILGYLVSRVTGDSFVAFHTNQGVLPNHYALFKPHMPYAWSFLYGVSTPSQVAVVLGLFGVVFLCFTLGYRTRLFGALSLACMVSLHHRMPLMVNGSMVMTHLLLLWSLALPLGRHYSLDAWLRRRRGRPAPPLSHERVTSLGVLGFRLQLFFIYLFNVVHKTGETWMEGSAVHYVLWQDRIAMGPAVWIREHAPSWFSPAATYGTLVIEALIALCLVLPLFPRHARRMALAGMILLHGGIGLVVNLGPFPFVFPAAGLLMMASGDWTRFDHRVRRRLAPWVRERARKVADALRPSAEEASPSTLRRLGWRVRPKVREAYYVAVIMLVAAVLRHDNPVLKEHLGPVGLPEPVRWTAQTLYVPQGWALFAPEAPKLDGLLVLDGVLADGTRVDPLRHAPPDFDIMEHGPFGTDYFWQTYVPKLVMSQDEQLWKFFTDYALRIPEIEQWAGERELVYLAAYYVGGERPRPDGEPVPEPTVELYTVRGRRPPGHTVPPGVPLPEVSSQEDSGDERPRAEGP